MPQSLEDQNDIDIETMIGFKLETSDDFVWPVDSGIAIVHPADLRDVQNGRFMGRYMILDTNKFDCDSLRRIIDWLFSGNPAEFLIRAEVNMISLRQSLSNIKLLQNLGVEDWATQYQEMLNSLFISFGFPPDNYEEIAGQEISLARLSNNIRAIALLFGINFDVYPTTNPEGLRQENLIQRGEEFGEIMDVDSKVHVPIEFVEPLMNFLRAHRDIPVNSVQVYLIVDQSRENISKILLEYMTFDDDTNEAEILREIIE